MEGGDRTVTVPSVLAANSCALLSFLEAGDHVLVTDSVYFPTRRLLGAPSSFRRRDHLFRPLIVGGIASLIRPETKSSSSNRPGRSLSRCRTFRPSPRRHMQGRHRGHGQHLERRTLFPALRPRGRRVVPGGDQVHRWAFRRHARHRHGVRQPLQRVRATANGFGYCAAPDDCYLGCVLRSSAAAGPPSGERAGLARWLAERPEFEAVLHPALPAARP